MVDTIKPASKNDTASRKRPITISEVPQIPRYLPLDQFRDLIPPQYADMVQATLDKTNPDRPLIALTFLNPEYKDMDTVYIPQTLFNSQVAEVDVPMFIFEHSSVSKKKIDYFGVDSHLVLNINQVLYLVLQHRLAHYARQAVSDTGTQRRVFTNLISTDLRKLRNFVQHEAPKTYNGKFKVEHTYAVISHEAHRHHSKMLLGEAIHHGNPDEDVWKAVLADLQGYVQPSSETSMQKRGKITLYPGQLYRSPGYEMAKDGSKFKWICPPKQNVPARGKTHILGDAKELLDPATSCFQQDNLFANGVMTSTDRTLKEAIVVYHPMNKQTKRFVAGEVEASLNIAEQLVFHNFKLEIAFRSEEDIQIEKGQEYHPDFNAYTIGVDVDDQEIKLYNLKSFKVLDIVPSGLNGSYKVYFKAVVQAGNARIVSNTGLKGVTKIKPNLGKIYMPKEPDQFDELPDGLYQYVKEKNFNNYTLVKDKQIPKDWHRIKPDLVLGMNAVKAKSNTIVLSQAALAVKLGYYVPKAKGQAGYTGILNTLDVNEINDAANSLPDFVYVNEFGVPVKVFVGLAYIGYTELGSVYTEFKPQSFAFESGWVIKNNSEELFNHIRDTYMEEDKVSVAKELYKILEDKKGVLRTEDGLPVYTMTDIRNKRIFDPRRDLFRSRTSPLMSTSKLIDFKFNPNGFFINLRPNGGPMIRIPSARTLRFFIRRLPNGEVTYHELMFNISKIIRDILGYTEKALEEMTNYTERTILPSAKPQFIFQKYEDSAGRMRSYDLYMNSVKGTLYTSDESKQMIVQSLVKPKIPGVNMKQVTECLLPSDVVVISDDYLYRRIVQQAEHEDLANPVSILNIDIELLTENNKNENKLMHTNLWKSVLENVPRALAIRNPMLWESQVCNVRVWSKKHLEIWLKYQHGIKLSQYLDSYYNRDVVLVAPDIILISHSDCDGDLLPIAVLDKDGQELLKDFRLNDMLEAEQKWNEDYWLDEYETDLDLKINEKHVYQLYEISNVFDKSGKLYKNYPQFVLNSSIAKGNIGSATIDIWALKGVLQWYKAYGVAHNWNRIDENGEIIERLSHRVSEFDLKYLPYVYTRLVQERVIEAIKHLTGGSSQFQMYYLDNITSDKNLPVVQKQLEKEFDVGRHQIGRLLGVIAFAIANDDALKAVKNFISKYNKGKMPADPVPLGRWEQSIQESTYFGSLITPLFEINQAIKNATLKQVESSLIIGGERLTASPTQSQTTSSTVIDIFNMD